MMNKKPVILVTGANGQLGKELKKIAPTASALDFVFLSREDMPIHHFEMVRYYFKVYQPAFLINCAAYTAVDRAEQEKDKAFQINAEAVGVLAAVCKENHCGFIHISTDYVFDGKSQTPYQEDAKTNPQSVYGHSKLKGEEEALRNNPDSIIIRTAWVYCEYGKNFVRTMLQLMKEKESINVVHDQVGAPTYAYDLAVLILHIITSGKWQPGIYHFTNIGKISWYDFAIAIKEISGSDCIVKPIPTSQYPTPARRPAFSVLDTQKVQDVYGVEMKNWKESLKVCLRNLL